MTESSELLESIKQHLQEQQAELLAFRLLLMTFINRVVATEPDFAEERLHDLKTATLQLLENTSFEGTSRETSALARTQTQARIEALFHDLERALSEARTIRGESGRH